MDGNVKKYGCDAILCAPGTFAVDGMQVSSSTECVSCPGAPFYGATDCKSRYQGNVTERNVLIDLYESLNGTNWGDQTNWNSDEDHCTWFGIVCDDGRVSEINMEFNGLVAISDVSSLLFGLPNLVKLDLKGTIPAFAMGTRFLVSFLTMVA
jgi:Leucine rich repeat N-terminal domain